MLMVFASIFLSPLNFLLCSRALSGHVWSMGACLGGSTHTALLNRVESKAYRLINSPALTDCLDSLNRHVTSLFLFYCYFHVDCSSKLANCMSLPFQRPRCTRLSTSFNPYSVHLFNAGVN